MDILSQQAQLIIQEHGIAGYFGAACMFVLIAAIYISIFLAIGMLFYSIFSKNWRVWRKMEKKINKFVYWTPRILSIILILFLTLFSFDAIEPGLTFWQILGGLFMHNIPVFILIIALLISWRYEIVGGIVFILAGLLYIWLTIGRNEFEWDLIIRIIQIAGPAFLIGILFLIGWFQKKSSL